MRGRKGSERGGEGEGNLGVPAGTARQGANPSRQPPRLRAGLTTCLHFQPGGQGLF